MLATPGKTDDKIHCFSILVHEMNDRIQYLIPGQLSGLFRIEDIILTTRPFLEVRDRLLEGR